MNADFNRQSSNNAQNTATEKSHLSQQIRCPQCGETKALDSNVVVSGKNTRTYLTCRVCKKTFRDAQDLEKEFTNTNPRAKMIGNFLSSIPGFLLLIFGLMLNEKYNGLSYFQKAANEGLRTAAILLALIGLVMVAIGFCRGLKSFKNLKQLLDEKEELH